MTGGDWLRALASHWRLLVVAGVLGVGLGWVTGQAPGGQDPVSGTRETTYQATHLLVHDELVGGDLRMSLPVVETLAASAAVRSGVEEELAGTEGLSRTLSRVSVVLDQERETLSITATGRDPELLETVVDTYARVAQEVVAERNEFLRQQAVDRVTELIVDLQERVGEVEGELATAVEGSVEQRVLSARRQALLNAVQGQLQRVEQLTATLPGSSGFTSLQAAVAVPASPSDDPAVQAPDSRPIRAAGGLVLGVLAGAAAALARERLHPRLRSRRHAEWVAGLPVVGETPYLGRTRGSDLQIAEAPSEAARSFDRLRLAVERYPRWVAAPTLPAPPGSGPAPADHPAHGDTRPVDGPVRTLLVVSPATGDGRTTTVANLAASAARVGVGVTAVPTGPASRLGALRTWGGGGVADPASGARTGPVRVGAAPSAGPRARETVHRWRREIDAGGLVVVDTRPLASGTDVAELAPAADAVLLVVRYGRTGVEELRAAREQLARLRAPVTGMVLAGVPRSPRSWLEERRRSRRRPSPAKGTSHRGRGAPAGEGRPAPAPAAGGQGRGDAGGEPRRRADAPTGGQPGEPTAVPPSQSGRAERGGRP